jgi:hypothetical protein
MTLRGIRRARRNDETRRTFDRHAIGRSLGRRLALLAGRRIAFAHVAQSARQRSDIGAGACPRDDGCRSHQRRSRCADAKSDGAADSRALERAAVRVRCSVRLVTVAADRKRRVLTGRVQIKDGHIFGGEASLSQRLGGTLGLRFLLESSGDDRCRVISAVGDG